MKNEQIIRRSLMLLAILLAFGPLRAQDFSLEQAVDYAVKHNLNIKNAQLDALSAEARIGEIRAAGLPQLSAAVSVTNNIIIPRFFLPANAFDPTAPADAPPAAVEFGIPWQGSASANLNQLIFNGSYFIGLKAAATYRELAQKSTTSSKVQVAESVTKAYYSAQVAEERAKLLDLNISRVDSLMRETKAMNASGFVELLDVNRLEVQINNLQTERQKVQNLIELSYALLKYQMGMPANEPIKLTDDINAVNVDSLRAELGNPDLNYENRIEYSLLNTQEKLAGLDLRNVRSGYLPSLSASVGYGYNAGYDKFSQLFTDNWYNNMVLTVNLNIPIFDGFSKRYQINQKKIAIDKVKNSQTLLKQSIDLENNQASINIKNAFATLETQKRNLTLAEEIVRVSKIKYKEGVGSNIEVINAESSLKEAQTNYFTALYDLMIAKVDLSRAKGELYTEK
ncbi:MULTISPECIES: TolC family protein [Dyadobacter]|uniref:TolC family protein n=1 Tax=Dyadobacter chenhuakuii TaxID=2909339 RepID=A0A9X1TV11_9BACT|nr:MULTISPECIES: TolC family protein [Dyadobacter]MCE7073332.1 TolC family protein [Dyadobacter sp. CY327]MCF2496134.1 TolC family protein [Dyadobacter chenhuakuii]MCF2499567.1 TolC family protein [Dyadobacter chenhuakuii]USJ30198.1 TolC family protein [Dyadobacter chenhuakuii]